MTQDKSREAFEKFCKSMILPIAVDKDESYANGAVRKYKVVWQASRDHILSFLNSDRAVEVVADSLWEWRNEGRKGQVIDIEWSLLKDDFLEQAKAAIAALVKEIEV